MAITAAGNALVLSAVTTISLDNINYVALYNSGGEYFRKAYESKTVLSATKYQYTFYLTELEGNDTIVSLGLCGNGATVTLETGTTFATQTLELEKTETQSLYIVWTVELI